MSEDKREGWETLPGHLSIPDTDLEVVAYENAGGNLMIRVNKGGVCVADVSIVNADARLTDTQLVTIGALTRPVIRDLLKPDILDLLRAPAPSGQGSVPLVPRP